MNRKKLRTRILSLALSVAMTLTMIPQVVFATEGTASIPVPTEPTITVLDAAFDTAFDGLGKQPATVAVGSIVPRTTPLNLATNADITYIGTDGNTKKANPTTTNIIDTGEGWSWHKDTNTLTLSGVNIDCSGNTPTDGNVFGIQINADCTIFLTEGTTNTVKAGVSSNSKSHGIYYIGKTGNASIGGNGTLYATGGDASNASSGIFCTADKLTVSDATIIASSSALSNNGIGIYANLDVKSGTVTATATGTLSGYGINATKMTMSGGNVTANGKNTNNTNEYGIKTNDLNVTGGTLSASGKSGAIYANNPIIATGATATGTQATFTSGETKALTQAGTEPVVVSFAELTTQPTAEPTAKAAEPTAKAAEPTAKAVAEQFNLPLNSTYYFDLSSEVGNLSKPNGTINDKVPDTSLHYVPFTYAGTVNAYSLDSSSSGRTDASVEAAKNPSDRSLFVADYNISNSITWNTLNTLNNGSLIFGKNFDTNYTLRSLSAGSSKIESPLGGSPTTNEWDSILNKSGLTDPIKNYVSVYSYGQDTVADSQTKRAHRGKGSANEWGSIEFTSFYYESPLGFRPALEVLNVGTLGKDGLTAITLDLNGGSFDSNGSINIVCAGKNYKAPSGEGLTPASLKAFNNWNTAKDGSGTSYAVGAPVPKSETTLYARWKSAMQTISFDARNGNTIAEVDIIGGTIALPTNNPTWGDNEAKNNYTFAGWYYDIDGTGTEFTNNGLTASKTVYAKWTKNGKTVRTTPLDLTGDVTAVADQGWTWESGTKKLTLSGATIDCSGNTVTKEEKFGIRLHADSNIVLTNGTTNTVKAGTSSGSNSYGIYIGALNATGKSTISGKGTLNVTAGMIPIPTVTEYHALRSIGILCDSSGALTFSEATIDARAAAAARKGDGIDASSITIESGNITATGAENNGYGIAANNMIMTNGTVTAYGKTAAIISTMGITATNAAITGAQPHEGILKELKQSGIAPVVISFDHIITVTPPQEVNWPRYGKGEPLSYTVKTINFEGTEYHPDFTWKGLEPKGVKPTFSKDNATLTLTTTNTTPVGEYKFCVFSRKVTPETGVYASAEATLKVNKCGATITWGNTSLTYNGSEQAPTATVSNKVVDSDEVLVTVTGGKTDVGTGYTATANNTLTGKDAGNYSILNAADLTKTFEIIKAPYAGTQATPPSATPENITDTSITLTPQTVDGKTVEYAKSTTDTVPTNWQEGTAFSGLTAYTEYTFFARVKATTNHNAGATSAGKKIRTNINNTQKIVAAKEVVKNALAKFTAYNTTNADTVMLAVNTALTTAGITGVTPSWTTDFTKIEATVNGPGSVKGVITLTCGTESGTVTLNKIIAQRPIDPARKITLVKGAIESALSTYPAINETIEYDIENIAYMASPDDDVVVTWGTPGFEKILSTDEKDGSIKVAFNLKCGEATGAVLVNCPILRSADQKLNDAKTKSDVAVATIKATNNTIATNVMTVVENVLSNTGTGITAAWKENDGFKKTLATESATGSIKGTIVLTLRSSTKEVTLDLTIAKLPPTPVLPPPPQSGGNSNNTTTDQTTTDSDSTDLTTTVTTTTKTEVSAELDGNGTASINVTDEAVTDAIQKAQAEGTNKNGVSVELSVETGDKKVNSITANLSTAVQDTLVKGNVTKFKVTSQVASLTFDSKTLQEIQKQAGGDAVINASKTDVSTLSKEAQDKIGNRPVFDLSITGANGTSISDFGGGSVAVSIPYKLQPGENPANLQAYFIGTTGEINEVMCTYDPQTQCLVLITNHFSVYGIGYKENATKFNDAQNHWAKNDIEFVLARGLFTGTSENAFSPDAPVTTKDFVTALTKLSGKDISTIVENSDSEASISRFDIAVIMKDFAKLTNCNLLKVREKIDFTDITSNVVTSMQMAGVMMGKNDNLFDPMCTATRAEVSAVLHRYVELLADSDSAQGIDTNDSGSVVYYENGKLVKSESRNVNDNNYEFNANGEAVAQPPKNSVYGFYTVKKGDSFWKIAHEHNCNMYELAKTNGKTITSMIHPGDVLQIPQ